MLPSPPPYDDDALRSAFPTFDIALPELGLGTFKAAYRVFREGEEAVLKVVKEPATPAEDGEMALPPRFDREIAAMRRVTSDRIVSLLEGPEIRLISGRPHVWYLEPYYAGGTLLDRLATPLAEAEVVTLGVQLLEGVDALWSQARLVHRDIKPGNIVFGESGPVLLDLGIALHADLTPLTNAFGVSPRTPRYAAPEQFDIRHVATIDSRTDQFLVGIVLFEAATGAHPFLPGPSDEYLDRLACGSLNAAALETLTSDCLVHVLRRLLKPDPHERYRTAALARRALEECARP